jgi:hypothetical protein
MVEMSKPEKLARAVLLFFNAEPWTRNRMREWVDCTGKYDGTSKVLCDLAREVRADEEAKNSG